jgi:prepilin-type N-terminal cleavage/methylation domain-containing protein
MYSNKKQQGFTLIELVIVIVILGILAATAAPKFIDLSTDARIATLKGMQGAMSSGTNIIYSKAIIQNKTNDTQTLVVGSASISLHSGYPIGKWEAGIRNIVNLDAVAATTDATTICNVEWCGRGNQTSIPSGVTTTASGRVGKVYPKGYSWNDECGAYYLNHADGREPEIGVETDDC